MATRLLSTQRIVNLASDPGSGSAGEVYYNTVASKLKFYNGSSWAEVGGGSGTVTSVGISVPTGLSVSGSPITSSGTLAVSLASGYEIPQSSAIVHIAGTETITGAKTFSATTTFTGNVNISGVLDLTNTGVISALDMSNNSITGVNTLSFADPGASEGITWTGGNGWYIYESPDTLTNAAGNLQIVLNGSRHSTFKTDGSMQVLGAFSATSKSFDIQHPTKENMRLRYGSLEGPELGVYVRGRSNSSIITLPDYWTGLVDEDSITVQVTPIGKRQKLFVKNISNNTVEIGGVRGEFFYFIQAERKDIDKLVVEYGD